MNIIFLTMANISGLETHGIYSDLMRKFRDAGHEVYIVSPRERRTGENTSVYDVNGVHFLKVKTLNLQKSNVIEKGVGQVLVESQYKMAIKRYLGKVKFDLILYTTPPITFPKLIEYLKIENPSAKTYLLLKDIFPQNAVDLGLLSKSGIKGYLYRYFRKKEKKLYALSDHIGCMSPANVEYVLKHNPEIAADKVEVAPNSVEMADLDHLPKQLNIENSYLRDKYQIPRDIPAFVYGGNLGKPQGIPFLIRCLEANANRDDCYFVIVGSGTELPRLKTWYKKNRPSSVLVLDVLPKHEYDDLVGACDVGLVFLDHRFTIPNYPSRILSYLENKMPVLCVTDPNTDIGIIAQENGYGYWCESDSVEAFTAILDRMIHSDRKRMGENGYEFLRNNYLVDNTYKVIMRHFESSK